MPFRLSKWRIFGGVVLVLAVAAAGLELLWDWNWFRPLVEARMSTALGRTVTLDRLEVHPGRVTALTVHGVKIANPPGFDKPDFATVPRLSLHIDVGTWLRTRQLVLAAVEIDQPNLNLLQNDSGEVNWNFPNPVLRPDRIGAVEIHGGSAHLLVPREQTDVTVTIATTSGGTPKIDGSGTFNRQPVTLHAVGGTLLALRNRTAPYPVDVQGESGESHIVLKGTIRDPFAVRAADLAVDLSGPDLALLMPLTDIELPRTPAYRISSRFHFSEGRIDFSELAATFGATDLSGELHLDPTGARPVLTGALTSEKVNIKDVSGLMGAKSGHTTTSAADVHVTYHAEKVVGEGDLLDNVDATLNIESGIARLSPLRLGVGNGSVSGVIDVAPDGDAVNADADITIKNVNIARFLRAAGLGRGDGSIDGSAQLKGRGDSLLSIVAHGDGGFRLVMPNGGDISSLLVDLAGTEFGRAFFAAVNVPVEEHVRCMVADFVLKQGILASRSLEADTTGHIITGGGRVDFARQVMELTIRADPKHFTIGTFATPIRISGQFKNLHVEPNKDLAIRGGIAAGLGLLFPPAALLPTIQFGVGDKSPCAERKAK
jgi:uncharacterized protein involved in outer membrane biogenesis